MLIKIKITIIWSTITMVENVLTYAASIIIKLETLINVHMMLPTMKHVLVCLSDVRLSPLTIVASHIQQNPNVWDTTLAKTLTKSDKVKTRTQWLGILLQLGMIVRVSSALYWNFLVHELNELSNLLNLLHF